MVLQFMRLEWKLGEKGFISSVHSDENLIVNRKSKEYVQNKLGECLYQEPNKLIIHCRTPMGDMVYLNITDQVRDTLTKFHRRKVTQKVRRALERELSNCKISILNDRAEKMSIYDIREIPISSYSGIDSAIEKAIRSL